MSSKEKKAQDKTLERNKEIYKNFQSDFKEKIASDTNNGQSKIQMLERMLHTMNSEIIASNLKYAGEMIETLDEDEIIASKKENSKDRG